MATRKLTMEQAEDLRDTRARTGASYGILAHLFGITVGTAWEIVHGRTYKRPRQNEFAIEPTPHDEITFEGWNQNTTPLPPLESIHSDAQRTYAAQNERDGYLTDPAYIAAVAAWKAEPFEIAAD